MLRWPGSHPVWTRHAIPWLSPSMPHDLFLAVLKRFPYAFMKPGSPPVVEKMSYSSGCYPKSDIVNPILNFILGVSIENSFNQLKKLRWSPGSLVDDLITSSLPLALSDAVHTSFPRLGDCLTVCLLLHLSCLLLPLHCPAQVCPVLARFSPPVCLRTF